MENYAELLHEILRRNRCSFRKQGQGDFSLWWSPLSQRFFTVETEIRSRRTLREVLAQAGLQPR